MKNTYKNAICMMLVLLVAIMPINVLAETSYNLYVDSDQNVRLVSVSQKNFRAGDIVPVAIKFESDKFRSVNKFKVSIKPSDEYVGAFTFNTTNESIQLTSFYEDTIIPEAMIKVSPSLKAGIYPVTFEWEYYDVNQRYTGSETVNFTITGRSDNFIYIESGYFSGNTVGDDNKTQLTVNITNPSDYVYQQIEVYFNSESSDGFSLYENFQPVYIENIRPNETKQATFSVYANSSISTGNHPLNLTLNYRDPSWNTMMSVEDIYVELVRKDDSSSGGSTTGGTPRIIISNYDIDVEQIQAGKGFGLDFSLKNTSTTNSVSNIKVVASSTTATGSGSSGTSGEVFFPAEGSNSFYIASIPVGGESTQSIELMTKQDVEPGVYSVLLKIDYEFGDGSTVSSEEQIAFSVTQEQRLEIQGITPPFSGQMGSTMPLEFQFINKGKAIIYNMSVTAEGDFELEGGDSYVGNLPAGYNDYYDAYLIPTKSGEATGAIVLKFEDSVGNPNEVRSEFTVFVEEGFGEMGMGDFGMGDFDIAGHEDLYDPFVDSMGGINPEYMGEEEKNNPIVIIIVAVAFAGIGWLIAKEIKASKKAKLEEDEDEDD